MFFLNAEQVQLEQYYELVVDRRTLYTVNEYEQEYYIDNRWGNLKKAALVVKYLKGYKAPKKVSLSINQYTMYDMPAVIELYKQHARYPYKIIEVENLRTVIDLEEGTSRLVVSVYPNEENKAVVKIKLSANYIQF